MKRRGYIFHKKTGLWQYNKLDFIHNSVIINSSIWNVYKENFRDDICLIFFEKDLYTIVPGKYTNQDILSTWIYLFVHPRTPSLRTSLITKDI